MYILNIYIYIYTYIRSYLPGKANTDFVASLPGRVDVCYIFL